MKNYAPLQFISAIGAIDFPSVSCNVVFTNINIHFIYVDSVGRKTKHEKFKISDISFIEITNNKNNLAFKFNFKDNSYCSGDVFANNYDRIVKHLESLRINIKHIRTNIYLKWLKNNPFFGALAVLTLIFIIFFLFLYL